MKLWVYKNNGALKPATKEDSEKYNKLANGKPIMMERKRIRNPKLHRKYFAFIGKVWENLPEKFDKHWPTKRSFRKAMECYAGHFTETITLKGERLIQPKSIAYGELDDIEFGELYKGVKSVIGKHVLPEIAMETVEQEIAQFYG